MDSPARPSTRFGSLKHLRWNWCTASAKTSVDGSVPGTMPARRRSLGGSPSTDGGRYSGRERRSGSRRENPWMARCVPRHGLSAGRRGQERRVSVRRSGTGNGSAASSSPGRTCHSSSTSVAQFSPPTSSASSPDSTTHACRLRSWHSLRRRIARHVTGATGDARGSNFFKSPGSVSMARLRTGAWKGLRIAEPELFFALLCSGLSLCFDDRWHGALVGVPSPTSARTPRAREARDPSVRRPGRHCGRAQCAHSCLPLVRRTS